LTAIYGSLYSCADVLRETLTMLNFFLGWTVALGSLGFYLAGYLLPEVRREKDAIWSGVGLIYALALLTNGDNLSVGLLVGQLASATLIGWFGWQILQQRRDLSDSISQTPIPNSVQSVFPFLKQGWERLLATYTTSEDEDGDLLASGFKKASAMLAGRSDSTEPFNAPSPSSTPEATPIDADDKEDWGDEQPSESASEAIPINPVPESSLPTADPAEQAAVEHVEDELAEVESVEMIASRPEPAPPEEPPIASINPPASPATPEVTTPSLGEEIKIADEAIPAQTQTVPEEQTHAQEPDSPPDLLESLSTSSLPTIEEEWPPKEIDDIGHPES
jgi:Ycf66 protein N-terminus